jgi:hypothetical protein
MREAPRTWMIVVNTSKVTKTDGVSLELVIQRMRHTDHDRPRTQEEQTLSGKASDCKRQGYVDGRRKEYGCLHGVSTSYDRSDMTNRLTTTIRKYWEIKPPILKGLLCDAMRATYPPHSMSCRRTSAMSHLRKIEKLGAYRTDNQQRVEGLEALVLAQVVQVHCRSQGKRDHARNSERQGRDIAVDDDTRFAGTRI